MKKLIVYFSIVCICLTLSGCGLSWIMGGDLGSSDFLIPQWKTCDRQVCPHCKGGHITKIGDYEGPGTFAYKCDDCGERF